MEPVIEVATIDKDRMIAPSTPCPADATVALPQTRGVITTP